MTHDLHHYLRHARRTKTAIGHFNFATADVLRAIVQGSVAAGASAVMVGTSEGEAQFLGIAQAVALVDAIRQELQFPVFLNADHFRSFEACKAAIDAGYDSILFDGARLPYEDNVEETRRVWQYAQTTRGNLQIEGELGYLKGASEVQTAVHVGPEDYTQPEQAADFVQRTGVERLAVVFGNIHGIVTDQKESLDIPHLERIIAAVPDVGIVLHGASGLDDAQVRAAISAGVVNVHFNTELRLAYAETLDAQLDAGELPTTPYKYLGPAADAVEKVVAEKTRVFLGK